LIVYKPHVIALRTRQQVVMQASCCTTGQQMMQLPLALLPPSILRCTFNQHGHLLFADFVLVCAVAVVLLPLLLLLLPAPGASTAGWALLTALAAASCGHTKCAAWRGTQWCRCVAGQIIKGW
jgi:hypothetical protein